MRRLIFILIVCFMGISSVAQTNIMPESLLDISKRNQPSSGVYTGKPFVKIEPTVGSKPVEAASGWMDEEKKRLFGTTQITKDSMFQRPTTPPPAYKKSATELLEEIKYKTPLGKEETVMYVPHTTDFITLIKIVNEEMLVVEEIIQYIQPENKPFSRVLSANPSQPFQPDSFTLAHAEKDGKPFDLKVDITSDKIRMTNETVLPAGVHTFYFKYIIQSGIQIENGQGTLNYNITGYDWPLPVNRFMTIVSFPSKTTIFDKDILFGSNNIAINNSFKSNQDSNGNTTFQLNNPLPAYGAVKLYMSFKSTIFTDSPFEVFFNKNIGWFVVLLTISTIFMYLIISAIYLRFKKPEANTVKFIQSFSPEALAYLVQGKLSIEFINAVNRYVKWAKREKHKKTNKPYHFKGTKLFRLSRLRLWKYGIKQTVCLLLYFRLSFKYWFTAVLMIAGIIYSADRQNIHLTFIEYFVTFILSGGMIYVFFRKRGQKDLLKEVNLYRNKMTESYDFFGLSEQAVSNVFTRHYLRLLAIKSVEEWIQKVKAAYPEICELPFLETHIKGEK